MKKFKRVVSAALASCMAMTSAGAANIQTTTQAADMYGFCLLEISSIIYRESFTHLSIRKESNFDFVSKHGKWNTQKS